MTVEEDYEAETWAEPRHVPLEPGGDPSTILDKCVSGVEDEEGSSTGVGSAYRSLSGSPLAVQDGIKWPQALHTALSHNELVYRLNEELAGPRALDELPEALEKHLGRPVAEAEILAWLTLGAAARCGGRPLLRPVIHSFVRGIGGAVVSFQENQKGACLRLAANEESPSEVAHDSKMHLPVTTCTVCGQHYYVAFLKDFSYTGRNLGGGDTSIDGRYWASLDETLGGKRVVLVDHLIGETDPDDHTADSSHTQPLYFCRQCAAAHPAPTPRCRSCGKVGDTVVLRVVRQNPKRPGYLTSCLSCGSNGRVVSGRYREPARPVRGGHGGGCPRPDPRYGASRRAPSAARILR